MRFDPTTLPDVTVNLDLSQQELVLQHVQDELRRMRRDPLRYGLPPHAGQEEVHCSLSKHILLIAANRYGKSFCGMRETLWRATGTHPYKRNRPHRRIWVGFPSYPFYIETTRPIFDALCPKHVLVNFSETEKIATIRRADGGVCEIHFKPYEQGREKWQGAEVDFIWMDEEHPEDISREAMARLISARGDMLRTLTPVSGMGWIYDKIYLPGQSKKRGIEVFQGALAEYDETKPNCVGEILVPHLDEEQVLRFADEIPDEDERAIRIFGMFRARSGAVYKQYREEVHVVPAFEIPRHWYVWGSIDPGYHGFAVLFYAQSPQGRIYVVREFFSQEQATMVRFEEIAALYQSIWPPEKGEGPVEPAVFFVDTEDPQVVLELNLQANNAELPLAFASLDQGLKARKAGVLRVQQMLSPSPKRPKPLEVLRETTEHGEPQLYFFDTLASTWRDDDQQYSGESRVLWEILRYLWKKPKRGSTVKIDEPDDDSAGGAHALAALRYGIMSRMGAPEALKEDAHAAAGDDAWVWSHMEELEREMLGEAA